MQNSDPPRTPLAASRGVRLSAWMLTPFMVVILLAEIAAFVAFLQRRMTWVEYLGASFVGILGAAALAIPPLLKIIDGWTRQDEAKIAASAPKPTTVIASGEGASASVTENHTPAETPTAKRDSAAQ